jgi:hypothetical protein
MLKKTEKDFSSTFLFKLPICRRNLVCAFVCAPTPQLTTSPAVAATNRIIVFEGICSTDIGLKLADVFLDTTRVIQYTFKAVHID